MKLNNLMLVCSLLSTGTSALELCRIGEEINVLDKESFNNLSEKNYRSFSDEIMPEDLFPAVPEHLSSLKPNLHEATYVYNDTSSLLETGPASSFAIETEEASRLLSTIGRSASEAGSVALEALGPIGEAAAVGLWARDVADTFEDESRTSYDRFATVVELVDWFGVLKLPEHAVDRYIISNRWDSMASGNHYSFSIHDDIVTQQDLRDKKHWAELASNQHKTLESIVKNYASDIALKYQLHYQETVKAQALLANELMSAVDQELEKTLHFQLGINKEEVQLFSSDIESACRTETDALFALYPNLQENNNRPSSVPSTSVANRTLAALLHCQQYILDQAITKLNEIRNGQLNSLNHPALTQLYTRTLNAKKKIAETADNHVRITSMKLQSSMRSDGLALINRLFDSGTVEKANAFFKDQASRYAVDEMARSLLYRPATSRELSSKVIILEPSYRYCSSFGILAGDPNFRGCLKYTRVPAETRRFDPSKDEIINQITVPLRETYYDIFNIALNTLIQDGWNAETEEQWLEQQILDYSEHKKNIVQNRENKAEIYRWLFDSRAQLGNDCIGRQVCAGWSSSYLMKANLSRTSSLADIARWLANYSGRGYYVHRKRLEKLDELIKPALESEWKATQGSQFYSYAYPSSFDMEKYAPLIASALEGSTLDVTNLSGNTLSLAKGIVKSHLIEAVELGEQNGADWLLSQVGDFQRYTAIVHSQHTSLGRHSPEMETTPVLFSEMLPAYILRYLVSDLIPDSYDARLINSINSLYNPSSELGQNITQLVNVNQTFNDPSNQTCDIDFMPLKEALLAVSSNESLYWLSPISNWLDNLTRQQLMSQAVIGWGARKQIEFEIECDISPNSLSYQ
ncbi:hypothetical protein [Aliivibrio sp. S10_S31]|uniref:hypothetical protein n=1 Tax=Aliivibrio sp. S10_S31 TaxID=2720224 RepID=UPI0016806E48|nr:hypothetical protein [Aliivibrio sp. S10_S31]MBD1569773.1 hypothetical protein [Aliivibrio sp. S10_S31]